MVPRFRPVDRATAALSTELARTAIRSHVLLHQLELLSLGGLPDGQTNIIYNLLFSVHIGL